MLDTNPIGTLDSTTDWYDTLDSTWKPAHLTGWHTWGFAPGTDSWINASPTKNDNACLNTTIDYRVRFALPADYTDASGTLNVLADNAGIFFLNGQQIGSRYVNRRGIFSLDATVLQPGVNELIVNVEDWGEETQHSITEWISKLSSMTIRLIGLTPTAQVMLVTVTSTAMVWRMMTSATKRCYIY